ncbi:TrkH family potassium uptake protein [Mycoplasmoides pirum]|uniref:TrkH family potassium uptake protein n=1 Tax=Mycoplasmoides pirum TaxID=2122 RepID=UPI000569579A|nr:potassium transporter TrkG [Mycoplasmoides pirum]
MNIFYHNRFNNFKKRHQKLFKVLKIIFIGDTVPQKIVHFYIYLILIGAILLYLPISLTSYPEPYKKIINEDFFANGTYSALAKQVINVDLDRLKPNNFYSLGDNLFVVFDPTYGTYKVIETANFTFLDALFTAASAFSDTGLSTLIVRSTYSIFGQVVIVLLIQIGGIGFIVIFFLIWKFFKSKKNKQDSFSTSIILRAERGNSKLGGTTRTIIVAIVFIFVAELIYAIFYSLYFNFALAYEQQIIGNSITPDSTNLAQYVTVNSQYPTYLYHNPMSIWAGIFHSISSMNNAGFDIIGSSSLSSYSNDYHAVFLFITMSEFIVGGIGYPVVFDIYEKIRLRKIFNKNHKFRFSLFTKVSLITTLIISILGIIISTSVEMTSVNGIFNLPNQLLSDSNLQFKDGIDKNTISKAIFGNNPSFNAVWRLMFETMSTRSAGFSTINNFLYTDATKGIFIALMFIGAAPSSTAGGIRTTTFAVICLAIWAKLRGKNQVRMFKRGISNQTVNNSFVCFLLILIVLSLSCIITKIIIDSSHPDTNLGLIDILYEFSSAFGTVGLTTGVSGLLTNINPVPFILTILLMIIGQLGVSTTLLTWVKKNPNGNLYSYPSEDLKIG